MRIAFMGSPDFAVPALELLAGDRAHQVVLVVTQPDKPAGRGKQLRQPPVKRVALASEMPVIQPESARSDALLGPLRNARPDICVVVAYGKILPAPVLSIAPRGCINIHASLLPKYRGAAPIQWAIIRGELETGVTIMQLDEGMDTGPMLLSRAVVIAPDDTAGTLHDKLAPVGAALLIEALGQIAAGTAMPRPQQDSAASYAAMLTKRDGAVDWTQSATAVRDQIRGVDPWPGAYTLLAGQPLKLFGASIRQGDGAPGQVLDIGTGGLRVACGQGACVISQLQAAGKRRMSAAAFSAGRALPPGLVLGA